MPKGHYDRSKIKKATDTREEKVGQEQVATMKVDGPAVMEKTEIQKVDGPGWKEKADLLKFMEEIVHVVVHTTTDKNEPQFVEIRNDGRVHVFPRGIEVPCKRKFVEVLARAKTQSFRNEEFRDQDGNNSVRWPSTVGLRYPFEVRRDDNPRGREWLRKVLQEA